MYKHAKPENLEAYKQKLKVTTDQDSSKVG
jgi:hypothetical protein